MKLFLMAALMALPLHSAVASDGLILQIGNKKVDSVALAETASLQLQGRSSSLELVGAGLRKKTVFGVRVYVGQLLGNDARVFVRNEKEALGSTDKLQAVAMHFTFLRNVGAEEVMNALKDSLDANDIDVNSSEIRSFLQAISRGGDLAEGKTFAVIGERLADGKEVVSVQNTRGEVVSIEGRTGFVRSVLSMWLGNTTDSHLANFKKEVIGGVR